MSKNITVSSLSMMGGVQNSGDISASLESEVERMINDWDRKLQQVLAYSPDLIVLPEACDRYHNYSLERRMAYYDVRKNEVRDFFCDKAKQHSVWIAYSGARTLQDGTYRNTTQLIDRNGDVAGLYDKNFPTIGETQDGKILPGKEANVIECELGRVACAICFDLNFDELWDTYKRQKPNLVLFSSAYHGGLMQNYRAYQCRSYFVGSIMNVENTIINPVGQKVACSTNYIGHLTHRINLDYAIVHLDYNRGKMEKAVQKYGSRLKMHDPGFLGSVLFSSETDDFTIEEIIREFKIEVLDDYFDRVVDFRKDFL